ncbi:DEAD/DEAH box helicase [Candidatus Woesearchaeota archaeon]|nr:DEAD/DEAH box helicase [Candidatus Woesearchaeota archaeon]
MIEIRNFSPREYQKNILETCKKKNTLVCLPTGTGKTKAAILLAVDRLNKHAFSKVVICSPTKPLASQICKEFKECTNINPEEINLLTGQVNPELRAKIWNDSQIIVATPQTIESDLEKKRISLENVSLLCIDECHRSKENFANTTVAKIYNETAKNARILGLTASPGSSREIIDLVCQNLFIESVEVRTQEDEDIKEYIQEKDMQYIKVDLPEEINEIRNLLTPVYLSKVGELKKFGMTKPTGIINKKDLLMMQRQLLQDIRHGNPAAYSGISMVTQAIKLSYLIELVETQSLAAAKEYLVKLEEETSKAATFLRNQKQVIEAKKKILEAVEKQVKHPKLLKLMEILQEEVKNPDARVIVFANLRTIVDEIVAELTKINIKAKKFVGQSDKKNKGLKQKEQIETIEQFKDKEFKVLVASSVGEEGLDIPEVNAVIFYEPVASELRRVQRSGRTGRTMPGRIIYLITKKTRDEAYHWVAQKKEIKMQNILQSMKRKQEQQTTLDK